MVINLCSAIIAKVNFPVTVSFYTKISELYNQGWLHKKRRLSPSLLFY